MSYVTLRDGHASLNAGLHALSVSSALCLNQITLSRLLAPYTLSHPRLIQQLSHNKSLTEEEVRRLKGQLTVIEAEYKASERK